MREKIKEQILASASMKEAMVDGCMDDIVSVSYTHLTLPTNREV